MAHHIQLATTDALYRHAQSRYMLGDNGGTSYVVGFGKVFPGYVQSMGASCPGTPSHPIVRPLPLLALVITLVP